jgi:hypothetical protein
MTSYPDFAPTPAQHSTPARIVTRNPDTTDGFSGASLAVFKYVSDDTGRGYVTSQPPRDCALVAAWVKTERAKINRKITKLPGSIQGTATVSGDDNDEE